MNQWYSALGRSLVSIAILAFGIIGFLWMGTPEVPVQEPYPEPPPLVTTAAAIAHTEGISFDVDGVVVPYREIEIAAQISGKVQYKSDACRIGRVVRQGDLLLRIEPDDYELEVRRLTEELAQAKAMIAELEAEINSSENQINSSREQLAIDTRQLKRSEDLMRRSAASDSEVDSAMKAELGTRNTLQSLLDQKNLLTQRRLRMEAAKSLVQANLEKAQLNLKRTEIFAPIDGVIVTDSVEQDGYIQSGGTMVTIQDTSQLDVSCQLYMRQLNWLWQSDPSVRGSDAFGGGFEFPKTPATVIYQLGDQQYAWQAVADRYEGAGIDSQTRMVPCRIHVDDPTAGLVLDESDAEGPGEALVTLQDASGDGSGGVNENVADQDVASLAAQIAGSANVVRPPTLMTGMFVKVRIHATPPMPLVRLPQQAIQPGNKVWTVESGKLHQKSISIANSNKDSVVAYQRSGGLQAGDLIVTSPLATPVEGMQVSTDVNAAGGGRKGPPGRGAGAPGAGKPGAGKPGAGKPGAGKPNAGGSPRGGRPE